MENLDEKIKRVVSEKIDVVDYDLGWPQMFEDEKRHLLCRLPNEVIVRIEHFGSTAVPGLSAKPIIDMLVEVTSLDETQKRIAPVLEAQGYDYFWRPTWGDETPPFYAWFIKRNSSGQRTHHIHMIENTEQFADHWERLLFRDYLIEHAEEAKKYQELKIDFAHAFHDDRIAYTNAKTAFIMDIMKRVKR